MSTTPGNWPMNFSAPQKQPVPRTIVSSRPAGLADDGPAPGPPSPADAGSPPVRARIVTRTVDRKRLVRMGSSGQTIGLLYRGHADYPLRRGRGRKSGWRPGASRVQPAMNSPDPLDLTRFVWAQEGLYEYV